MHKNESCIKSDHLYPSISFLSCLPLCFIKSGMSLKTACFLVIYVLVPSATCWGFNSGLETVMKQFQMRMDLILYTS